MDVSWEMEENSVITVVDFYLRRRTSCMVEAHSRNIASRKNFLWPNLVWIWSKRNVVQLYIVFTVHHLAFMDVKIHSSLTDIAEKIESWLKSMKMFLALGDNN